MHWRNLWKQIYIESRIRQVLMWVQWEHLDLFQSFTNIPVWTNVFLHHSEEEHANARPGIAAVLLCPLLVFRLAGVDSRGCRPRGGWRGGCPRVESEMCISGSTSAQTRLDQHFTVLAQTRLLFQQPGPLLPVKLDVRVVFEGKQKASRRTRSWSSGLPSCRWLRGQRGRHLSPPTYTLICPRWPVCPYWAVQRQIWVDGPPLSLACPCFVLCPPLVPSIFGSSESITHH